MEVRESATTQVGSTSSTDVLLVKGILAVQLALTLILPVAALAFGASVGLSALVGAAICASATAAFAFWAFRDIGMQAPGVLVGRLYVAEIAKIFLVLGLFVAAFAAIGDLNIPALVGAYFAVQVLPPVLVALGGRATK